MQSPDIEKTRPNTSSGASNPIESTESRWLCWLHEMLPDVAQLLLFRIVDNEALELCAHNPAGSSASPSIVNTVKASIKRARAIYVEDKQQSNQYILSLPFRSGDKTSSYVLVMCSTGLSTVQQHTAHKLTLWAAIQLNANQHALPQTTALSAGPDALLSDALVKAQQEHGTFTAMSFALVNTLANLCGCERVSLGCFDAKQLQVMAISGQSVVDGRRRIARQLQTLMLDMVDADRLIYPNDESVSTPAVQAYFNSQGKYPLLALCIPSNNYEKFFLVLERAHDNAFLPAQADAIEQSVQGLVGLLELSREQALSPAKKLARLVNKQINNTRYVQTWSKKRWVATIACAALLLSFVIPVSHRVSANAFIEASDRQVLIAAQDGFILSAHARAGEEVAKGDLLAKIDGQDLQLGLEKWRSEKDKNKQEYAQALATHDRSELSRLRADAARIDAEIALLDQQLLRSEVRAPFDGVLLDGDWTQSLGAPVKTGDVLFEIASAEQYRLVLEVDEHDIGYIEPDQVAQLRMAALPTSVWQAELGAVMPVAVSEKGSSAFRIPANIEGEASALRPGMEGVGKVHIGSRSMFWVYTHRLLNKLRYVAWKVGLA